MKCTTAAGGAPAAKKRTSGWERTKFSKSDHTKLKKLGLLTDETAKRIPGDEMIYCPDEGWRVIFLDFLLRGLSLPAHEFLRGLLFVYGVQLHQLTPNSILHIVVFITLCDFFLDIHPHWDMWKRLFALRRNASRDVTYDVGGVVIVVRPEAEYFDLKMADSVQNWRKKWLYVKDEKFRSQEFGIAPLDLTKLIKMLTSGMWRKLPKKSQQQNL